MASVKRTNKQIHDRPAHIDSEKVASFTDADIARFAREDDSDTSDLRDFRYVPPRTDVRALRERLGLSQAEFDRAMPHEFWREVVDRVAVEVPGTLLLAEAFWLPSRVCAALSLVGPNRSAMGAGSA